MDYPLEVLAVLVHLLAQLQIVHQQVKVPAALKVLQQKLYLLMRKHLELLVLEVYCF